MASATGCPVNTRTLLRDSTAASNAAESILGTAASLVEVDATLFNMDVKSLKFDTKTSLIRCRSQCENDSTFIVQTLLKILCETITIRYTDAMAKTRHISKPGRELDALAHDDDLAEREAPLNAEFYRYSCPVDHAGHMVSMRGWRCKDTLNSSALLLVHDVGEEIWMYREAAKHLCEQGFSCYGYDQRGHGQSSSTSGRVNEFQELVNDLLQVASWVRHMHNGNPPIIIGQGYGGLIACELLAKHPEAGAALVLSAPTVDLARKPTPMQRLAIRVLAEIAPQMRLPVMLRPRFSNPLHRDYSSILATRIVESLIKSNDIKITATFAKELLQAMDRFPTTFGSLQTKVMILRPEADEVACFERMRTVVETHANSSLVEFKSVPEMHHNSFTETPESMHQVAKLFVDWIRSLPASK